MGCTVAIYDLLGRKIVSKLIDDDKTLLSLPPVASSSLLAVIDGNGTAIQKLLVAK
jgi:hypothetical protein